MTLSQKQIQKKKQKKQAKRKNVVKNDADGLKHINVPWRFPLYECLVPNNIWEHGLGQIIIAHQLPRETIGCAFFLVDVYCQGIRECYHRALNINVYRQYVERLKAVNNSYVEVMPVYVKALINGAIDYAAQLGLEPPASFSEVKPYLDRIADLDEPIPFKFGKHDKPFYVAGKQDSLIKVEKVLTALRQHVGDGHFNFMAPIAQPLVREGY